MHSTNSSISAALSLRSLDDDDFRNLLNSAAKPQYGGSLQRKKKKSKILAEYGGRRLSDAGENTGLSTEADNLLAQFRREAELNQLNADIGWPILNFIKQSLKSEFKKYEEFVNFKKLSLFEK